MDGVQWARVAVNRERERARERERGRERGREGERERGAVGARG